MGCMHGLLTCLDCPHRLAYILGEILEMDGVKAASTLTFHRRRIASVCLALLRR